MAGRSARSLDMRTAAGRALVFAAAAIAALLAVAGSPIHDAQGNPVPIETLRGTLLVTVVSLFVAGVCFAGALGGFALLQSYKIAMWRVSLLGAVHGLLMAISSGGGRTGVGVIGGIAIVAVSAAAVAFVGGRLMGRKSQA